MSTNEHTTTGVEEAIRYAEAQQTTYLAELSQFLRIASIGTQPEHNADTQSAAEWLENALRAAGMENVRLIATPRHPLVYADWLHASPGAPTVLIYGHYDVQPADPLALWHSDPFEPQVRDGYLYARGASDDKGQLYIHVKAVEAYLRSHGRLPVNVKFIVEGEEESGGDSLAAFVPQNQALLAADVALVSDSVMLSPDQPVIVYGLRGICYMFIDITGPARDLHSGSYGGGINNPLNVMGHVIAKLKDEEGHILIPGFYDKVRPLTAEEGEMLAQFPLNEAKWLAETGAPSAWGEPEYSLVERLGTRPTLDFNGIIGGYTGPGGKTVLPSTVHAKLSMRLVPDQDPAEIAELVRDYVQSITPASVRVKVTAHHGGPPSITNFRIPAIQAAVKAFSHVFGTEPVFMREGGSIPVVSHFQTHLNLETVLMGFGLPDDNIHCPNERFYLDNFYRGIQTAIHFLANFARMSHR